MESPCLFCLEPIQAEQTINPIGCHCKIQAHKQCFDAWFVQKNQLECPICHAVSVPNRVLHDNIHIVYINTTEAQERERHYTQQQKAAGYCCLLLLGWSIGITILDLVSRS